jgi:hypothetical protein
VNAQKVTIVILLGVLMAVTLIAPRTRARSLLPVVAVLLGVFWEAGGFMATLRAVARTVGGFIRTLPIH